MTRRTTPPWQRLVLALGSAVVFLLICEAAIRLAGVDTNLTRNKNFRIAVPVWLLADDNWVDIQRGRLDQLRGVRAGRAPGTTLIRRVLSTVTLQCERDRMRQRCPWQLRGTDFRSIAYV